jgi:hypothetical protein
LKQQDLVKRLRDELAHIVAQTEGNAAMGLTDHNKIAENLICGLMREILGFRGVRNLNASEHANYPAIDLRTLAQGLPCRHGNGHFIEN